MPSRAGDRLPLLGPNFLMHRAVLFWKDWKFFKYLREETLTPFPHMLIIQSEHKEKQMINAQSQSSSAQGRTVWGHLLESSTLGQRERRRRVWERAGDTAHRGTGPAPQAPEDGVGGGGRRCWSLGCSPWSSKKKEPFNLGPKGCEARPPWASRKTEENLAEESCLRTPSVGTHPCVSLVYRYRALRGRCYFTAVGS